MKTFKINSFATLMLLIAMISQFGCKKQEEWLDVKRNKADVVPESLADFQAILDNTTSLNNFLTSGGAVGTDDVYIPDVNLASSTEPERNLYLWNRNIWINDTSIDWNSFYGVIEYANIVLDGLKKIDSSSPDYNAIRGQALFWRGFALYQLSQLFCKPYEDGTASADLGLPVRISSDVNKIYHRASLKDTYAQIVEDITLSVALLRTSEKFTTRPIRPAALAFLARVYLNMSNYSEAFKYADLTLKERNELLDYNSGIATTTLTYRFPANGVNNSEILFFAQGGAYLPVIPSTAGTGLVDGQLYSSYSENDLRKSLFFASSGTNQYKIRGTYTGNIVPFFGIALNETYLIRAECFARSGKLTEALRDLNFLLKRRFKANSFVPVTAMTQDDVLRLVIIERRKELAFVGIIRWEDLRRLNKDSRFSKTISRTSLSNNYTLLPNDPRYVLPIPENEIRLSGLEQNIR